jgi:hypothetical protein
LQLPAFQSNGVVDVGCVLLFAMGVGRDGRGT